MTYLRWLHKTWNFFWTFTGVLILTLVLVCGSIFGALQLKPVKAYMAGEIENRFSERFNGVLDIGEFDGLLPFIVNLKDVQIYSDSTQFEPVFEASEIDAKLDVFSIFRNQFIISGLHIEDPEFIIDSESSFSLQHALSGAEISITSEEQDSEVPELFQLLMPLLRVENGTVHLRNVMNGSLAETHSDTLIVQNIDLEMYFEFTSGQRFIDIGSLTFRLPEFDINRGKVFGQIYNDSQFLELNAFNIAWADNYIQFNGEADGVNILEGDLATQLQSAILTLDVNTIDLTAESIREIIPEFPPLVHHLQGNFSGEGTVDSFWLRSLEFSSGESYVEGSGYLINAFNSQDIGYGLTLNRANLSAEELTVLTPALNTAQVEALAQTYFEGAVEGSKENISGNLSARSARGNIDVEGNISLSDTSAIDISIQTDSLDIGGLIGGVQQSKLTMNGEIKSSSFDFEKSNGGLFLNFQEGSVDNRSFDYGSVIASWKEGFIEPSLNVRVNGSSVSGSGWIDLRKRLNEYSFQGKADDFEVHKWLQIEGMQPVLANFDYEIFLKGNSINDLYGQVSLDVPRSIVGGDTLNSHQLYFDFNEPGATNRMLRLTSTAFDATLEGNFIPTNVVDLASHWSRYFRERVAEEILLKEVEPADTMYTEIENQHLVLSGRLKNTDLIRSYFPDFPDITTSSRLSSTINISSDRLLFNASVQDPKVTFNDFVGDSLLIQVTGSFRYGRKLKEFASLQLQTNAASMDYNFVDAELIDIYAELNRDSIKINQNIGTLAGNNDFIMESKGKLHTDSIALHIHNFSYGNDEYQWEHEGNPSVVYNAEEKLTFSEFSFKNIDQFIRINGTISDDVNDAVNYEIGGIQLDRVSRLIDGRLSFGGTLNGIFTTQTLTTVPTIQGDISIESFDVDGNLVGDINLTSRFNSTLNRFDTQIEISTDSTKYPQYFSNTDRQGQNFDIEGYVLAPIDGNFPDVDSLFVFDIDFNNIDMWILPIIGPKIFTEGSGLTAGTGKIWGNLETYDFRADFQVGTDDAVYLRPRFLDTYYYAQGDLTFTRDNGLEFHDIFLIDPSGGNAILSGFFDFNDFQPISYVGIQLEMDEFQFLNSSFDPSAPFYGNAYGSSIVTISGTNLEPVLRSETPIILSDFSEIGIPLLEETELNEDNKFIRFVDSFEVDIDSTINRLSERNRLNTGMGGEEDVDLSFAERFTLDLQFEANDPMTVQLIFDPVTGDIVTADGTGRMRIRLEDEQVSMFGRFDITGGRYQFVSGDIFSRRFELEPGGSITWEGDPANARLNLNAIYRARPDINTLTTARSEINPENSQRVPVELVLNIGGTISSIENDFYFRLPETIETRQSSTLATQIASLNRDEELKLLQSANFLLMGDFIPVSDTQTSLFGENLSGSAAVLNPLLSSQVISPLLSNQMNSLLNSDLSSLDVDFNLNTYNQVDLGVALRLYNDRLILRREGQITGRQSNIGDIGATYRINRTFAVTAFHRQDPTFGTLSSTEQSQQSQDINGVGVEAKVSFDTWKEFFQRLTTPFRKLFGINRTEEDSLTENRASDNPL